MKIPTIVRLLLTLVLLYFSYLETGVFTLVVLTLLAISNELHVMNLENVIKTLNAGQ